jgi:plastocyanin
MKAMRASACGLVFLICSPFILGQSTITIHGQVKDASGSPIPGASVRIASTERAFEHKAGYDGEFIFPNIAQGKYELEISFPGFKTKNLTVEAGDKVRYTMDGVPIVVQPVPEPFSITLEVGTGGHCTVYALPAALPAGVTWGEGVISYEKRSSAIELTGRVNDQLGVPLSKVTVKLVREGAAYTTVSNEKGEFTFTGLEPGKYSLQSTLKGYTGHSVTVWITRENLTKAIVSLVDSSKFCFE